MTTCYSVRELAQYIPEDKLRKALEEFECSRDSSIERFVRNESLEFAEDMYGTTYIFVSSEAWKKRKARYIGHFYARYCDSGFQRAFKIST